MRLALALLALALLPRAALAERGDPREVTARQDPRRDGARLPWFGVRLGGVGAVSSAGGGTPSAGGGGAYALFDAREFLADVAADVFVGDRTRLFALGIGAYYPFGSSNVTPYLGGGVKVGWSRFGGDGVFGMLPFAAAGVVVGREGYVQLRAELAWIVSTGREQPSGQPDVQGTRAHGPMGSLGIAF